MINSVSLGENRVISNKKQNLSFGAAIFARVVKRSIAENGDIYYSTLMNKEKGVIGVYHSLAHKVSNLKDMHIIRKLIEAVDDLKVKKPLLNSTIIGSHSDCKRVILTGKEAKKAAEYGPMFYRNRNYDPEKFKNIVNRQLVSNPASKRYNKFGEELGIDLIVEQKGNRYKLVEVEVTTLDKLNKHKPSVIKPKQEMPEPQGKTVELVQDTLDFLDDIKPSVKNHYDYE